MAFLCDKIFFEHIIERGFSIEAVKISEISI